MNTSAIACDDGNLDDGDGCSSVCQVQPSYDCLMGSQTSASFCLYKGNPLVFDLMSVQRVDGYNKGVFKFSVYPPILVVTQIDLSQYVFLECASTYTITELTYHSGVLEIDVDYSEDM